MRLDPLEPRRLLSADLINGLLLVKGTANPDQISASLHSHQFRVTINNTTKSFPAPKVDELKIRGFAGSDTISLSGRINISASIIGDRGNDRLSGSDGRELFDGGGWADEIFGGGGQDKLFGNIGNDTLHGGDADDFLSGDAGNDSLLGDGGQDLLTGDEGGDTLFDHSGNDTLWGMEGNDRLDTKDRKGGDELHDETGKNRILRDKGDFLNPVNTSDTEPDFPWDDPGFSDSPFPDSGPTTQPTTEPTTQPSDPEPPADVDTDFDPDFDTDPDFGDCDCF